MRGWVVVYLSLWGIGGCEVIILNSLSLSLSSTHYGKGGWVMLVFFSLGVWVDGLWSIFLSGGIGGWVAGGRVVVSLSL